MKKQEIKCRVHSNFGGAHIMKNHTADTLVKDYFWPGLSKKMKTS